MNMQESRRDLHSRWFKAISHPLSGVKWKKCCLLVQGRLASGSGVETPQLTKVYPRRQKIANTAIKAKHTPKT